MDAPKGHPPRRAFPFTTISIFALQAVSFPLHTVWGIGIASDVAKSKCRAVTSLPTP
jgi:hypothetical protein